MQINELKKRFPENEIEWRIGRIGGGNGDIWATVLAYVTNRAIMNRLDDVCGVENWKNEFKPSPNGGVLCGISIRFGDEWVTKWDGAENTDIEAVKGGLSGSMKRAAVQWGVGRYLYSLGVTYAKINDNGKNRAKTKTGEGFRWDEPKLPAWALPDEEGMNEIIEAMSNAEAKEIAGEYPGMMMNCYNDEDSSCFQQLWAECVPLEKRALKRIWQGDKWDETYKQWLRNEIKTFNKTGEK